MNMMNKMDDIQNQDLDLLQNILDHIDSDQTNIISDSVWCFKNLTLNFDSVLAIRKTYPSWNENIDLVWLVKILLLKSIEGVSSHILIRYRFDSILKTLWFLSSNNKNFVDRGDLQNYYTFLLMTVIHDGRIEKKLKPFCYHNFQAKIPIETWVNSLKFFNISPIGFKGIISEVNETKALKNTIETICKGDLTYRDWIEG